MQGVRTGAGPAWIARPRRRKGGAETGPNPTDRSKPDAKRHLVVDRRDTPLGMRLSPANRPDSLMPAPALDAAPGVRRGRGRPRRRPRKLHADKACDHRRCQACDRSLNSPRLWLPKNPQSAPFRSWACAGAEGRAVADAAALFGGERLGGHAWGIDDDPGIASTGTNGDGHRPAGRSRSQDGAPRHRPWPRAPGLRAADAGAEEHRSVSALSARSACRLSGSDGQALVSRTEGTRLLRQLHRGEARRAGDPAGAPEALRGPLRDAARRAGAGRSRPLRGALPRRTRRHADRLALLPGARSLPADLGALRCPPGSPDRPAPPHRRAQGDRRRPARDPLRPDEDRCRRRG